MFILTTIEDTIRIPPEDFDVDKEEISAKFQINKKYSNRVIDNVGFCLELYDILEFGNSSIYHGDGSSFITVKFRIIVFKPYIGEILVGTVKSVTQEGIQVTLGFFDQIYVPSSLLPEPSYFDEVDNMWAWEFDGHPLWIYAGEQVRFRVYSLQFNPPTSKRIPNKSKEVTIKNVKELEHTLYEGKSALYQLEKEKELHMSPMIIVGALNESGLGLTDWWKEKENAEEIPESEQNIEEKDYSESEQNIEERE